MAGVHRSLVNDDCGEVVNVLRGIDAFFVPFDSIREHVEGYGKIDVSIHFLGGGRGMLIALFGI